MASLCNTPPPIRWISLLHDCNIDDLDTYGENLEDESQLRRPLGFMKFFMNTDECVDYIAKVEDSYVVLTISGQYARHVIPHIHDFPQIAAVYIVCKPENK
ncbi:hypothetical protein I4U23_022905 [Adineta vaga]|nr:hypothetical protein I4U23_022905 [Adineta vaga]